MLASPQWGDRQFRNTARVGPGIEHGNALPVMREYFFGGNRRRPGAPLPAESPLGAWAHPPDTGLRATWLGHSTLLLEIDGATILTDPVWGERASPFRFMGPRRFQPVPVAISELPRLDAVVISHDHYDHLDRGSVVELAKLGVPIVTSLGVGLHLESWGVPAGQITELDWWESVTLAGRELEIAAAPSQHFSGRGLGDRNRTLWSSMVLRGPRHTAFFSGDTGVTPEYSEIRTRFGPFDLVMLEVGAFHPAWGDIHLGPDGALEALSLLGGGSFLPVHWGTFDLALHDWDQPAERLLEIAPAHGVPLLMPKLGAPVEPARATAVDPWWRRVEERESSTEAPTLVTLGEPID